MKLKIIKFKSVKSTNTEAIKLIKKNFQDPSLIIALNQTKGRGTRGKEWISKKGNIFISIYYKIEEKKVNFDIISLMNPCIIKNIIEKYSRFKVKIKWPNDLLIKKKKICGILQEVIEYNKKKYLITGIGINTFINPKNKNFESISLLECSKHSFKNSELIKKIKDSYEVFISDIKRYKVSFLKKKYLKGLK
ncbi:MAG: biotin--[acetyl-CoA-carboxylase] ligase [Pelagibacteraceae bacterium]